MCNYWLRYGFADACRWIENNQERFKKILEQWDECITSPLAVWLEVDYPSANQWILRHAEFVELRCQQDPGIILAWMKFNHKHGSARPLEPQEPFRFAWEDSPAFVHWLNQAVFFNLIMKCRLKASNIIELLCRHRPSLFFHLVIQYPENFRQLSEAIPSVLETWIAESREDAYKWLKQQTHP